MLAATRLQFRHPFTEELVCIEHSPTGEFQNLVDTLLDRYESKPDEPEWLIGTPNI